MQLSNFGRNLSIQPETYKEPQSEAEIIEILSANRGRRIRTIGSLHSWSPAPDSDDVLLNLRQLNQIQIRDSNGRHQVEIGAGCQLKHAIANLDQHGLALPSQGLITEQTVAGAISTGTHGSGKHSLSHYVESIRVAVYDRESGEPIVKTLSAPHELLAARCGLGCTGVILSITFDCQTQYNVEEHLQFLDGLEATLNAQEEYPLQQFYLLPHAWRFLAQHRKVSSQPRSRLAFLRHSHWFVTIDLGLHLVLLALVRWLRNSSAIRFFYRHLVPLTIVRGWRVVDKSQRMLTMEHELFRHIEMELFVKRSQLPGMLEFVQSLLTYLDGAVETLPDGVWRQLEQAQQVDAAKRLQGRYTHHYPICIRTVHPDDTLISMASGGNEAYYAVSFISYQRVQERETFQSLAKLLANATGRLFNARPHWGKVCPIDAELVEKLYPRLAEFRETCRELDSDEVFRNDWVDQLLFKNAPEKVMTNSQED